MHRVQLLALSVALCTVESPAFAQSATGELKPGATVRIRSGPSGPSKLKGTLISATHDSLLLATKERQIAVARGDVSLLDVKRRRPRGAGALRLATWVGAIGAAILGPTYLGAEEYSCGSDHCRVEGGDFVQVVYTGVATSVYGQVVGAIWPGSAWLPVASQSSMAANISPPARGSRVRITAPGFTAPNLEGAVATATPDSLSLIVRSSVINVPMTAVTHLEYANGSDRAAGALRGLMQAVPSVGLFATTALVEQTSKVYRNDVREPTDKAFASAMWAGAAISAAIGAGLGAIFAPDQWVERRGSTSLLVTPDVRHQATRVGLEIGF